MSWFVRLMVAGLFVYAGAVKWLRPDAFLADIESYRMLPYWLAWLTAFYLPPLEGADALRSQVFGDLDVKITTSTLDTLAKEAIADVDSSLQTIDFLLEQGEVQSAAKRLLEAF